MKFMLIRRSDKSTEAGELPSREMFEQMSKYNADMARAGVFIQGVGLKASSKGARVKITGAGAEIEIRQLFEPADFAEIR